jgi:S-adenosylmethionine:tRNA ribosyltransferase-isomerase
VVAVGTTSVRTLEAAWTGDRLGVGPGRTTLFVRPGFRFGVVDAVVTNFHLPRSTLLVLACAFGGTDRVLAAYGEAVARRYRFFSYGDAMLMFRAAATGGVV